MEKPEKKYKKRKKLNILKIIAVILLLYLFCYVLFQLTNISIKNIIVKNNYYLTDEEIIETAGIEEYPSFIRTSSSGMEKKLDKLALVKSSKVSKKWFFTVEIKVNEEKILYQRRSDSKYVLGTGKEINKLNSNINGIPILINYVPKDKEKILIKKLNKVNTNILEKISEIEYTPNKTDDERFLLYMTDGNLVYITLSKTSELNYYIEIIREVNNHKGILNLDSGRYFEIKE